MMTLLFNLLIGIGLLSLAVVIVALWQRQMPSTALPQNDVVNDSKYKLAEEETDNDK